MSEKYQPSICTLIVKWLLYRNQSRPLPRPPPMLLRHVLLQLVAVLEIPAAIAAAVRMLPVNAHVRHQVALHAEAMPANGALELLNVRVNQRVMFEVRRLGERFLAHAAGVHLSVLVLGSVVQVQAGLLRERESALADVLAVAAVGVGVLVEVALSQESLAALRAEEFARFWIVRFATLLVLVDALDVAEHSLLGDESRWAEVAPEGVDLVFGDGVFFGHVGCECGQGGRFQGANVTVHHVRPGLLRRRTFVDFEVIV